MELSQLLPDNSIIKNPTKLQVVEYMFGKQMQNNRLGRYYNRWAAYHQSSDLLMEKKLIDFRALSRLCLAVLNTLLD